jgi:hypothetical protein
LEEIFTLFHHRRNWLFFLGSVLSNLFGGLECGIKRRRDKYGTEIPKLLYSHIDTTDIWTSTKKPCLDKCNEYS